MTLPGLKPLNMPFPGGNDQGGDGGGFSPITIGEGTNISPGFGESIGATYGSTYGGFVPAGSNQGPGIDSGVYGSPGGFGIDIPGFLGSSGDQGGVQVTPASSSTPTAPVTNTGLGSKVSDAVLSLLGIKRLAIFLLGLICVIGAIYLYKPTQDIVAGPIGAAKEGLKGAAAGLVAA